jgi:hypothetical protein
VRDAATTIGNVEVPTWLRTEWPLIAATATVVMLLNNRWGRRVLYPCSLFSTWVHEMSHGVAALLVGGRIRKLRIFRDGSGSAHTECPAGRLRSAFVSSAGYLGTATTGSTMLLARHADQAGPVGLGMIGGLIVFSVVAVVRNAFGAIVLLLVGAGLIAAALKLPRDVGGWLYTLLAATCCLNAVGSIKDLFGGGGRITVDGRPMRSDAHAVSQAVGMPHWFWASLWFATSLALTYIGIRLGG